MFREKIPNKSFRRYITVWILIFAFIIIILFGIFSLLYSGISSKIYGAKHIEEILHIAGTLFEDSIAESESYIDMLADDEDVKKAVNGENHGSKVLGDKVYGGLGNKYKYIAVHILSIDGKRRYSTDEIPAMYDLESFGEWGVLRSAREGKNDILIPNMYIWEDGKTNAFSLTRRIYDKNKLIGLIIIDFSREYIQELFKGLDSSYIGMLKFAIFSENDSEIYNDTNLQGKNVRINSLYFEKYKKEIEKTYTYSTYKTKNIIIMGFLENEYVKADTKMVSAAVLTALVTTLAIAFVIVSILAGKIVEPINMLAKKVMDMDHKTSIPTDASNEIEEIHNIENAFYNLLGRIDKYHKEDIEKRELLEKIEVKALQSQINPHFLYNTLDSIKWEAKLNKVDKIAKIVTEFGNILKANMNFNETIVTVEDELGLVKSYLYIQMERYKDRFEFKLNVPEDMYGYRIPKLLLQPIVENAIIHGMELITEKGIVEITGHKEGDNLIFNVKDNGNNFEGDFDKIVNDIDSNSIGLYNVNKRIKLYYGEEYGLSLISDDCTNIQIKIKKDIRDNNV